MKDLTCKLIFNLFVKNEESQKGRTRMSRSKKRRLKFRMLTSNLVKNQSLFNFNLKTQLVKYRGLSRENNILSI